MNQILYTGGKNKKGGTASIQKTIIFFVVFIIIFGICAIGIGANLLNKVKNENTIGNNGINTTPQTPVDSNLHVEFAPQVGGVKLTATCDINIETISYWWDEETSTKLEVGDKEYEIVIPSKQGTHTLKVEITNEDGYKKTISQIVIGDAGPEVSISTDGISNYVIKATDDEEVEKIVIVLNGETEEIEVNDKEIEYKVAIPQGDSLIEVTAYNLNGLSVTKKAKITNFGG